MASHSPTLPRLACLRHTASVRPEPGSNSPQESYQSKDSYGGRAAAPCHYAVVKVRGEKRTSLAGHLFLYALPDGVSRPTGSGAGAVDRTANLKPDADRRQT